MAVAVDSARWLIKDIIMNLRRIDEVLSFIGLFYVGKVTITAVWDAVSGLRIHAWSKLSPKCVTQYGKWAVVAGGNEWTCQGYVEALAKKGINILLLSDRLAGGNVAQGIGDAYGVVTETVQTNFENGAEVLKRHLQDKDVGVVVVSAGIGGRVWEEGAIGCLVMLGAVVRQLLPGMVRQGQGGAIIIVITPTQPLHLRTPQAIHLYTAVLSFVKEYSRALEEDCNSAGITVQAVTPFVPSCLLTKVCGTRLLNSVRAQLGPTPSQFAAAALTTLGHTHCTSGHWTHAILNWVMEQVPEWMAISGYFIFLKILGNKHLWLRLLRVSFSPV